mgnify:FL=1
MSILRHASLRRCLRQLPALLILAAGGAALSLASAPLREEQTERKLRLPPVRIDGRDALSQQLALFSLGGLRSLAAEMLVLDATDAWLKNDWPRARRRWQAVTTLSPHRVNYWARASQEMARNAAAQVRADRSLDLHRRAELAPEYRRCGEQFLIDGLKNNPNDPTLLLESARFCNDVALPPRYAEAADLYARAADNGAPEYYRRWQLYSLCRLHNRKEESLSIARRMFEDPKHRSPSLCCILFDLQEELDVPEEQRLSLEQIFGSRSQGLRELRDYLRNDLGYPVSGVRRWFLQQSRRASDDAAEAAPSPDSSAESAPSSETASE